VRLGYVKKETLENATVANTDLLWTYLELNDIITSGYNFVSTTTGDFGNAGQYYFKAQLWKPSSWWSTFLGYFNPFSNKDPNIITSSTTVFTYGNLTSFEQFIASSTAQEAINEFIASSTTSIQDVKEYCSFSTSFSFATCLQALFIPSSGDITNAIENIKENIVTKFPLGYFNDFITIISTSTVGNLTILDAELPNALGFGNPQIRLDLTGVLDPILNATTSSFSNVSSSSTASSTLFETTNYYWEIIIWLGTLFYILSRIIGSQIIPRIKAKK